jgi:hypothetical protein
VSARATQLFAPAATALLLLLLLLPCRRTADVM